MTDFLPNASFRRENFPQRNRLIAGMAHATVVIESGVAGWSMNTANLAHRYGRELFAVPGRPTDIKSEGCHQLIFQHKAQLLYDPKQLIHALVWKKEEQIKPGIQKALFMSLDEEEQKVYSILSQKTKVPLDELALELGWKVSTTASQLMQMENERLDPYQENNLSGSNSQPYLGPSTVLRVPLFSLFQHLWQELYGLLQDVGSSIQIECVPFQSAQVLIQKAFVWHIRNPFLQRGIFLVKLRQMKQERLIYRVQIHYSYQDL